MEPRLSTYGSHGVTLLGDASRPYGVAPCFTERTGGVSSGVYASLNLGSNCGDDSALVARNRALALVAAGFSGDASTIVCPEQVHGSDVLCIEDGSPEGIAAAQDEAGKGYDAILCTVPNVPVLLCYADCVPVVLVAPGGFCVVHSGWKGTIARISAKAARMLMERCSCAPKDVLVYIGPHIQAPDYEVSEELLDRFVSEFGEGARYSYRHLDLRFCIEEALGELGIRASAIAACEESTPRSQDRFFSYRGAGGECGRHGAIAWLELSEGADA